jgi:hypothetical protein
MVFRRAVDGHLIELFQAESCGTDGGKLHLVDLGKLGEFEPWRLCETRAFIYSPDLLEFDLRRPAFAHRRVDGAEVTGGRVLVLEQFATCCMSGSAKLSGFFALDF